MSETNQPNQPKSGYVTAADGHVYHKSSTANASVAPTNQTTLDNADRSVGLSPAESQFVTVVDYHWHLHGLLEPLTLMDEYGYDEEEYNLLVVSPAVGKALDERGIPVPIKYGQPNDPVEPEVVKLNLSPLQLVLANTILDLNDTRSTKKKLQDAGVSTYKYNAWLKQPEFKAYLQQRSENLIGDISHEANMALADRVMSGDLKAIEYYNELTGKFTRASASGGAPQQDLQNVIVRIIEIIVDEVHDKETAFRISDRLKGLVAGVQVAGMLTEAPVIPDIAPARLTPFLQQG